jgi:signal-transduction protein with cAMP-binding, CBS, and nucleotidyltransferase domain
MLHDCLPGLVTADSTAVWSGALSDWEAFAHSVLQPGGAGRGGNYGFSRMVDRLADMRMVCGDAGLAGQAIALHQRLLAAAVPGEQFRLSANEITAMPVALGVFGRLKTVRSGPNRGKIPLEEQAIAPLRDTIRIMAVAEGVAATSTMERIRAIMVAGEIGVTLADHIAEAFVDFARESLRLELSPGGAAGEQFLDPEELSEEQLEQLRTCLEYVTTLQRLAYQQLVEASR